jgi:type VI secretion system FHA domain protein
MAPAAARQPRGTAGGHRAEAPQAEVEPGPVGFVASAAASGSAPVGLESQLREILGGVLGDHAAVLPVRDLLGAVGEMTAIVGVAAPRLMQALSSRTQFKDQLRLDQTMVRARDNNPLKFCDGAEEALQHMLLNDHPGLLQGRFAIEEAFTELATHQTALVGALQPALQETISQFAPDAVEAATESEGVGGFALSKGKGKLWDSYREIYARLSNPERGLLERRFMTALAQHYERKLKALQ